MFGSLKAGDVYADVGAKLDNSGFDRWERRYGDTERKAAKPIDAELGADVHGRGFDEFERKVAKAEASGRKIQAELGADYNPRGFAQYEHALNKAKRQAAASRVFKAHLGADFDENAFRAYTRELDAAGDGNRRFRGSMRGAEDGLLSFASRIPLVKWGLLAGGAYSTIAPLTALAGSLGQLFGLLGAVPGLAITAGAALGTLVLGFGGVGSALKAAWDGQAKAGQDAAKATKQASAGTEQVHAAEQQLTDAHKRQTRAETDLTRARGKAREELAKMRQEARDAANAEADASLSLRQARVELDKVRRGPHTNLELDQAKQAVRDAEEEARKSGAARERISKRVAHADLEHMPAMVAARRRVQDADAAVAKAEHGVARAHEQTAQQAAAASGSAATLATAMNKLSPAGQHFVRWAESRLFPVFRNLRAHASAGLLPGVERGTNAALKNVPVWERAIDRVSAALGRGAEAQGRFLGQRSTGQDLDKMFASSARTIDQASTASIHWERGLLNVGVAARPLVDWLGRMDVHLSRVFEHWAQGGRESGKLERFFKRTEVTTERVVRILWNLGAALVNIGSEGRKAWGGDMLKNMDTATKHLREWTESKSGRAELTDWFTTWRRRWEAVGDAISFVVGRYRELRKEGKTTGEALSIMLADTISKAIPIAIKAVAERAPHIAEAFVQGFLAANVWGKLAIGGWLLAKLGGGGLIRRAGMAIAGDVAEGFGTGWARSGPGLGGKIRRVLESGRLAVMSGADTAGSYIGGLASGVTRRAGRVRDAIGRQVLRARSVLNAAGSAGSAVAGNFVGDLVSGIRGHASRVRNVLSRVVLRGRAMIGAVEGAAFALGATVAGGIAERIRGRSGVIRAAMRAALRGRAMLGVVEGAAFALGAALAGGVAGRFKGLAGARGGAMAGAFALAGKLLGGVFIASFIAQLAQVENADPLLFLHPPAAGDPRPGHGDIPSTHSDRFRTRIYHGHTQWSYNGGPWRDSREAAQAAHRQGGGPVRPGVPYTVGETGIETFVPDVPGSIMPAGPTTQARASAGSSSSTAGGLGDSLERQRRDAQAPLQKIDGELSGLADAAVSAGERAGEGILEPIKDAGESSVAEAKKLRKRGGDEFERLRKDSGKEVRKLSDDVIDHFTGMRRDGPATVRRMVSKVGDHLSSMRSDAGKESRRMARGVGGDLEDMRRSGTSSVRALGNRTHTTLEDTRKRAGSSSRGIRGAVARSYESMDRAVSTGVGYVRTATSNALKSLGAKPLHFEVPKPRGLAMGRPSFYVDAPSRHDSELYALGRDEAVVNVHHQDEIDSMLAHFGTSVNDVIRRVTRPNYAARGKTNEEGDPPPGRSHWDRLIAAMNELDRRHLTYQWGGGHVQPARGTPSFDCSGMVSYATQHAGYAVPTVASGAIGGWGLPGGGGRAEIYYNPRHTFMGIRAALGKIGTAAAGRGGGYRQWGSNWMGWGNGHTTSGFATVHLPHLGREGIMPGGAGGADLGGDAPAVPRIRVRGTNPLRGLAQRAINKARGAGNLKLQDAMDRNAAGAGLSSGPPPRDFEGSITANATAYGPPWGGIQGGGTTATGVDLHGSPHIHGVAVDPSVIPLGSRLRIWPNPFGYRGQFVAFDTGGAIKGQRIDFYDWRGRKSQMGWGMRKVKIDPAAQGREGRAEAAGTSEGNLTPGGARTLIHRHNAEIRRLRRHRNPRSMWRIYQLQRSNHYLRQFIAAARHHPQPWHLRDYARGHAEHPILPAALGRIGRAAVGRVSAHRPHRPHRSPTPGSPAWRKRTAGWSSTVDTLRGDIESLGKAYDVQERRNAIEDEELIIEGTDTEPPRLNLDAIAKRERELDALLKIRRKILAKYNRLVRYIGNLVKAYRALVHRLQGIVARSSKTLKRLKGKKGGEAHRARVRAQNALDAAQGQLEGDDGAIAKLKGWQSDATDEHWEREGVRVDIEELTNEVTPLRQGGKGLTLPDWTAAGGADSADLQAQLTQAQAFGEAQRQIAANALLQFGVLSGAGDIGQGFSSAIAAARSSDVTGGAGPARAPNIGPDAAAALAGGAGGPVQGLGPGMYVLKISDPAGQQEIARASNVGNSYAPVRQSSRDRVG